MQLPIILFGLIILHCKNIIAEEVTENVEDFQVEGAQQVSFVDDFGFDFINIGVVINSDTLIKIKNLLRRVYILADQIQQRSDEIREKWDIEIENTEDNALATWKSWINSQLQFYNGSTNASIILENYLSNSSHRIHSCADLIRANIEEYEDKVYELRNRYSKVASFLAGQVPTCIVRSNTECQRKIAVELSKLEKAPKAFSNLYGEGTSLLYSDLEYYGCVSHVQLEFETGKAQVAVQINQTIWMNMNRWD